MLSFKSVILKLQLTGTTTTYFAKVKLVMHIKKKKKKEEGMFQNIIPGNWTAYFQRQIFSA